jgi:hypothetical protein
VSLWCGNGTAQRLFRESGHNLWLIEGLENKSSSGFRNCVISASDHSSWCEHPENLLKWGIENHSDGAA